MALPSGYKLLEYIQSSGLQWIDTNFIPDSNTRVVTEVETTADKPSVNKWVFGCRSTSATQRYEVIYISSASAFRFYFNTSNYTFTGVTLGRLSIDVSSSKATINGVSVTPSAGSFDGAGSIYICSCNSASVTSEAFAQKVYSFKIYDNGTLVRNYVPAERVSDRAVGLYDLVNNAFYTNAGTGAFTPGYIPIGPSRMLLMDGAGYDVIGGKALVDGTAYDILEGKVLIDGTSYTIPFKKGTPISELGVGASVFLNVNGVPKEFLVVHVGNPNASLYDASCDGVWLLMKDLYAKRQWNSDNTNNSYKASTIHTYLNGTFLNLFDADIKGQIKTVKIPYVNGNGYSSVASGSSGLSTRIFLLSGYEVGWTQSTAYYFPIDGACLSYFSGASNSTRVAYLNNTAVEWWLRSPHVDLNNQALTVRDTGGHNAGYCSYQYGVRPALILPYDVLVDDEFNVIT